MRRALVTAIAAAALAACGDDGDDGTPAVRGDPGAGLRLSAHARTAADPDWQRDVKAAPGGILEYRVGLFNRGVGQVRDVRVRADLPPGAELVFASAKLKELGLDESNSHPLDGDVTGSGAELEPLSPHGYRQLSFRVRLSERARGTLRTTVTVASSAGREQQVVHTRVARD